MEVIREIIDPIYALFRTLGQTISVWDAVDILIVAYVIYRILTLMRKTSAGSVIKGIILILAIAALANLLNLTVITYLLNQLLMMSMVVLVILFQPELRRLFEKVGSSKVSGFFRRRAKDEHIELCIQAVISATMAMKKSETGALIVFEREVGLNDYAATGVKIDSAPSSELIQNIFFENSPLHDGAVLLQDGRLLAAACMLPLSNTIALSRDLGMRHRAGIGISERSDAIAVIVSEQTGTISVAVDGMLKRHLSKETFEALLVNELINKKKTAKSAKRYRASKENVEETHNS